MSDFLCSLLLNSKMQVDLFILNEVVEICLNDKFSGSQIRIKRKAKRRASSAEGRTQIDDGVVEVHQVVVFDQQIKHAIFLTAKRVVARKKRIA